VHSATVPCSRLLNCISRLLTHGITSTSSHIQFNHHHFTASHSFRIEHLSPLLGKSCINTIQYTPSPLFDTRMRREPDATSRSSTASTLLRNPNISALSYTQILPDLIHLRIQRSCDLISKFTTRLADQTAQILAPSLASGTTHSTVNLTTTTTPSVRTFPLKFAPATVQRFNGQASRKTAFHSPPEPFTRSTNDRS
jgi:hypothetical protein